MHACWKFTKIKYLVMCYLSELYPNAHHWNNYGSNIILLLRISEESWKYYN